MGGRDAGGVGGLLRLFCCWKTEQKNTMRQAQLTLIYYKNIVLIIASLTYFVNELGVIIRHAVQRGTPKSARKTVFSV